MDDTRHEVVLVRTEGGSNARFESEVNYRRFKAILEQFTPKNSPFIDLGNTFIARKGSSKRRLTTMLENKDYTLDEMTNIDFQVLV